jgi:hypothetical protein
MPSLELDGITLSAFNATLSRYPATVPEKLQELDTLRYDTIPVALAGRNDGDHWLKKDEVEKLVEWKLYVQQVSRAPEAHPVQKTWHFPPQIAPTRAVQYCRSHSEHDLRSSQPSYPWSTRRLPASQGTQDAYRAERYRTGDRVSPSCCRGAGHGAFLLGRIVPMVHLGPVWRFWWLEKNYQVQRERVRDAVQTSRRAEGET